MSDTKRASPARRRRSADNLKRALSLYGALRGFISGTNRNPGASAALNVAEEQVEIAAQRYLKVYGVES